MSEIENLGAEILAGLDEINKQFKKGAIGVAQLMKLSEPSAPQIIRLN